MTKYSYSIASDTPNQMVSPSRLENEIKESAIVTAIDRIETAGDVIDVWMKAALSGGDETLLDGLVGAHSGEPLPDTSLPVSLPDVKLEDGRLYVAQNRVPPGYTLYVTGEADNIATGGFGGGAQMKFDAANTVREFQLLSHSYAIGARAQWQGCSIDCYFKATLIAPACSGFTNAAGDFDKVSLGGGFNMFKPVTAGTGAWTGNLSDKLTSTQILKATPVPVAGNVGWFDYNSDTNILTANMAQQGGYNLYDFPINLHAFARKVWGKADGETSLMVEGLVGKLLFNAWKIKIEFALEGGTLSTEKAALFFIAATQRNIA